MLSRMFFDDPLDPFFLPSSARLWGFADPFEEIRRDPVFRHMQGQMHLLTSVPALVPTSFDEGASRFKEGDTTTSDKTIINSYQQSTVGSQAGKSDAGLGAGAAGNQQVQTTGGESKQVARGEEDRNWLAAYARAPHLDIIKRDNEFELNVDVPGVRKEDLKVNITEDRRGRKTLTISGERKDECTQEEKDTDRSHRCYMYGSFSRSLLLPDDAQDQIDQVQAKQENGVLRIILPRRKEPEKKMASTEVQIQ